MCENIKNDPEFLLNICDDIGDLIDAYITVSISSHSIRKKCIENGLSAELASDIAIECKKRASKKANDLANRLIMN